MADWNFHGAQMIGGVITLIFAPAKPGNLVPMRVSISLENANMLTAAVLNSLRAAAQHGYQVQTVKLEDGRLIEVTELPTDRWAVTESLKDDSRCLLNLVTPDGMSLSWGLDRQSAQRLGHALTHWAEGTSE